MNIRTLRYYDKIDILKPEYINEKTNYRYYSINQFERLNTIKYLRALDVPLEKISNFFDEKDVNTLLSVLVSQRENVLEKQEELAKIEKKITNRIDQLNSALSALYGKISVKWLPQRRVMLLEKRFTLEDELEPLIRELSKKYCLEDAIFLGKVGLSVNQKDLNDGRFTNFSSVFLLIEEEDGFKNTNKVLPEGYYVTIQYQGTHEDAASYYKILLKYLEEFDYQLDGDSVEITIIDDGITNDQNKFVTELQLPFKII